MGSKRKKKDTTDARRLREIVATFLRHGIRNGTGLNHPAQLRMVMEELGPTFVKIGQVLSTRPDILPQSFIDELKKLHDEVRPESFTDIQEIIESEFSKPLTELFSSFEPAVLASASMAQVHLARLPSGETVVVKVLRPHVRETMLSDISILRHLAKLLKLTPQSSVMNPVEVVDELSATMKNELDLLQEAENTKTFMQNNLDIHCITCPKIFDAFCTSNVLTMEYIRGIKISDREHLEKEGYVLDDIASKLANSFLKQVFVDGFFHADPHPGNILIAGNKIAFIDFGMMGSITASAKRKFLAVLRNVVTRDIDGICYSLLHIAIRKETLDYNKFHDDVEEMFGTYIDLPFDEINLPKLLEQVFKVCRSHNLSFPRYLTMLLKGLMTLEGVVTDIAPDISLMDIALPFIRSQRLSEIDLRSGLLEQLDNLYELSSQGLRVPLKLTRLVDTLASGKLKVTMAHSNLEKSIAELNRMVNRLVFGIVIAAIIIGSSLIIRTVSATKGIDFSTLGFAGFILASVSGLWLIISILRSGKM